MHTEGNHDPYGALRYRNYRFLLTGSVLASIGTEIQAVVVGWELYQRTGSAADLGYAGLAQFLPVLVLSMFAGHAADRFSRKWILVSAQLGMTLTSVALSALSLLDGPVELIFLCLVFAGCCRAFAMPARVSMVPLVVPLEQLGNAVTWNSTGWQVANMTGPALGGLALYFFSDFWRAYVLAAACTFASAMLVALIVLRANQPGLQTRSFSSLMAGIQFVWRTKLLFAAITLDLFAVLLGGATALLPIFAKDILEVGPKGLGWLRAAPASGAFLMALLMAHRPPMQRAGLTLLGAVAGFGVATIGFGLSTTFWLSFAMLALTGAFDNISVVVRGTLMQTLTPDSMRGRVAAVTSIFISSSNELGGFESGMTAQWFGPIASVVGGGIGTLIVVAAIVVLSPGLVRLGSIKGLLNHQVETTRSQGDEGCHDRLHEPS
ncbi:MAG: MFS transporter [Planctomycetes bacterium]|nr:MFS transporter [Planctomycetota bacterium]